MLEYPRKYKHKTYENDEKQFQDLRTELIKRGRSIEKDPSWKENLIEKANNSTRKLRGKPYK